MRILQMESFMIAHLVFVGTMLATFSSPGDNAKTTLKTFTSKEGRFSLLLPDTPKHQTQLLPPLEGKRITQHMFNLERHDESYTITYQDNPKLKELSDELKMKAMEMTRDGIQKNLRAKLADDKKIRLDKHPGISFTLEHPNGRVLYRFSMYSIDERFYQVIVIGPRPFVKSKQVDQILDSFRLEKENASEKKTP